MSLSAKESARLRKFASEQISIIREKLEDVEDCTIPTGRYGWLLLRELTILLRFYKCILYKKFKAARTIGQTFKSPDIKDCIPIWVDSLIIWNDNL